MRDKEQEQARLDTSMPPDWRQANLEAAYERQKDTDAPYKDVKIKTLGEVLWIMQQRHWSGDDSLPDKMQRANLSEADLSVTNLSGAFLVEANLSRAKLGRAILIDTNLAQANLSGASLGNAKLNRAYLGWANLSEADCWNAHFEEAFLRQANLRRAVLYQANLEKAVLYQANLSEVDMRFAILDTKTDMSDIQLSTGNILLTDITWGSATLVRTNWDTLQTTGDEAEAKKAYYTKDIYPYHAGDVKPLNAHIHEWKAAVRSYQLLAIALREQGLNEEADRYGYRAQVCQRHVSHYQRRWGRALGSRFLDLIAGYGYRPERTLLAYLLIILGFTIAYMQFGTINGHAFSFHEGIIFSLTSFHGRGFFPGGLSLDDPITTISAGEAVLGLVIEVSFIATFTQRFFAR